MVCLTNIQNEMFGFPRVVCDVMCLKCLLIRGQSSRMRAAYHLDIEDTCYNIIIIIIQ